MTPSDLPDLVVDEVDLELIHALQVAPRATWAVLGRTLRLDSATVARRWQRLSAAGLAWVTCTVGPSRHSDTCMAYVRVVTAQGHFDDVATRLVENPAVRYVHHTTGASSLLVVVARRSPAAVAHFLRDVLDVMPGVLSYQSEIRTVGYSEPSRWRLRNLAPAQQQTLQAPAVEARGIRVDEVDRSLYELLHTDGRMGFTEMAEQAGVSEATVRRRVNRLLASGSLRLRCEVAQSVSGWPTTAILWARVPPSSLDQVARALVPRPEVRLSCSLSGPDNLLTMVWLRTPAELPEFERVLSERHPEYTVTDRAVCLHTMKQMGRQLDADGRCIRALAMNPHAFPVT
jgi:DNA-binding Lrp family transcriptional regulator